MRKINKAGKNNGIMVALIIGLLVIGSIAVYGIMQRTTGEPTPQDREDILQCPDATGILTVQDSSLLTGGTAPTSPTITCGIDGGKVLTSVTSGTTTFSVGAMLECLISDTDSIDRSFNFVMPCGGKTLDGALYYSSSDNPGIRIKNDDGDFMSDAIAGLTTNQTNLALGETLVLDVEFQGTNTEASGNGIWVIEFPASTSANITSVTLDGKNSIAVPSVHTLQNAASKAVAFEISNVIGSEKRTMTLSIDLGTGKDLGGGVYSDWYGVQEFVDDDSTLSEGIEDSDGDSKYENTLDFDFFINSA